MTIMEVAVACHQSLSQCAKHRKKGRRWGGSVAWRRHAYVGRANRRARWASFYLWPRATVTTAGLEAAVIQ